MKVEKVYHTGIPVNDLDRARDFYTEVLWLQYLGRVGGDDWPRKSPEIHGKRARLDRFKCGDDEVVLFERPQPLDRDVISEDGIAHQAFEMNWEAYDEALNTVKQSGKFHRCVDRKSGRTIYLFDTEGNNLELHFGTPKSSTGVEP